MMIMDVDSPANLKRSNSAPMINELNTPMSSASTTSSSRDSMSYNIFGAQPRTRRFSASFAACSQQLSYQKYAGKKHKFKESLASSGHLRLTPRVSQLRLEESCEFAGREAAHEKELHSAMQMSQSCEDLTIVPGSPAGCKLENIESGRLDSKRLNQPLHLSLPACPPVCSSPSPTRIGGRQCFSPGLHAQWKNNLSPSPTRRASITRRSQSPIAMRPSPLGPVKRKFDLEEEKLSPPTKRANVCVLDRTGLLITHNRLDATSSPLPGSLSSVGTPESLSSADSPGFTFRSLDSPSPGRPPMSVSDEPMHEERQPELSTQLRSGPS